MVVFYILPPFRYCSFPRPHIGKGLGTFFIAANLPSPGQVCRFIHFLLFIPFSPWDIF